LRFSAGKKQPRTKKQVLPYGSVALRVHVSFAVGENPGPYRSASTRLGSHLDASPTDGCRLLLFSYCVAGLLVCIGTRTVWRAIQLSLSLWLLISGTLLVTGQLDFGRDFLWIEGGYTFLAALL
jgi:hypothetical protein